jgi:hypothetical protein
MQNVIEIFEKNTQTLAVHVGGLEDLSLYTPYLTVKRKKNDLEPILEKTGLVSDPSTTYVFNLTTEDTSIAAGDYIYDIVLISPTLGNHTIIRDRFTILDGVKDL